MRKFSLCPPGGPDRVWFPSGVRFAGAQLSMFFILETTTKTLVQEFGGWPEVVKGDQDELFFMLHVRRETNQKLCTATENFNPENQLGEGGFGKVYKGHVENPDQVVAVKQLDRNGYQGNREFLVEATPLFKDRRNFTLMADPLLEEDYPVKGLHQALAVAAMCLQEEAAVRPLMSDVVTALEYLTANKGPEEVTANKGAEEGGNS
ncbi:hypothetical protein POUND7_006824 [Theobroma cacao]